MYRTSLKQTRAKKKIAVLGAVGLAINFLLSACALESCVKCFGKLTVPRPIDTIKDKKISLDVLYMAGKLTLRDYMWGDCPKRG